LSRRGAAGAAAVAAAIFVVACSSGDGATSAASGVRLKKIGKFTQPVYVTAPRGDPSRVFVVERGGRVLVVKGGHKLARPFLDISSDTTTQSERGLLSMAFAPDYDTSGLFYVCFTDRGGDVRIQEFKRSSDPDVADKGSRRNVITVEHSRFPNHNGGQIQFGPDGLLYAGFGDGGSEGDPSRHGQNLGTDLAKIIRIDPTAGGGRSYQVPASNPFVHRSGARPEIWAYGLRNPWRFSFDRTTGALAIGDVGQAQQEEVDFSKRGRSRGANYGWSVFEGTRRNRSGSAPHAVRPNLVRSHRSGWCAITGGYIVRDRTLRGLYGRYVYGDLCKSGLRSVVLQPRTAHGDRSLGVSVSALVSFGEDAAGHLYAVSIKGPVYRLLPR
jgi:glucose/arabinose dehydrogenase